MCVYSKRTISTSWTSSTFSLTCQKFLGSSTRSSRNGELSLPFLFLCPPAPTLDSPFSVYMMPPSTNYAYARSVSSPCYPRPYLHDLFMPTPYFSCPTLCLVFSSPLLRRHCVQQFAHARRASFQYNYQHAARAPALRALLLLIPIPLPLPLPLLLPLPSALFLPPPLRRSRDGSAPSGCIRILLRPHPHRLFV